MTVQTRKELEEYNDSQVVWLDPKMKDEYDLMKDERDRLKEECDRMREGLEWFKTNCPEAYAQLLKCRTNK